MKKVKKKEKSDNKIILIFLITMILSAVFVLGAENKSYQEKINQMNSFSSVFWWTIGIVLFVLIILIIIWAIGELYRR
ncbi:MAG: hypothetical protein AABW81_00985 [Nanoarchaeota archaeon]